MIGIVDYGMGNLKSVSSAFAAIGCEAQLVRTPEELARAAKLVIPGVGAFGEAMQRLQPLVPALHAAKNAGTKVLGICLGLQLMAERSFEHGEHQGLGWIEGDVRPLAAPHVGWNELHLPRASTLLGGIAEGECVYFVHGYALQPKDPTIVTATSEHGCAAIEQGNLFATQFHPEKSQRVGLHMLRSFAAC